MYGIVFLVRKKAIANILMHPTVKMCVLKFIIFILYAYKMICNDYQVKSKLRPL